MQCREFLYILVHSNIELIQSMIYFLKDLCPHILPDRQSKAVRSPVAVSKQKTPIHPIRKEKSFSCMPGQIIMIPTTTEKTEHLIELNDKSYGCLLLNHPLTH